MHCWIVLALSDTVGAVCFPLIPCSSNVPSAKTLVAGIVACEMAVLHEPILVMATRKLDLFVEAHLKGADGMTICPILCSGTTAIVSSLAVVEPGELTSKARVRVCLVLEIGDCGHRFQLDLEQAFGVRNSRRPWRKSGEIWGLHFQGECHEPLYATNPRHRGRHTLFPTVP